jgi:hypothetical protein
VSLIIDASSSVDALGDADPAGAAIVCQFGQRQALRPIVTCKARSPAV